MTDWKDSLRKTDGPRLAFGIKSGFERHDWEPGDTFHPGHTDPNCRICGLPRKDRVHPQ